MLFHFQQNLPCRPYYLNESCKCKENHDPHSLGAHSLKRKAVLQCNATALCQGMYKGLKGHRRRNYWFSLGNSGGICVLSFERYTLVLYGVESPLGTNWFKTMKSLIWYSEENGFYPVLNSSRDYSVKWCDVCLCFRKIPPVAVWRMGLRQERDRGRKGRLLKQPKHERMKAWTRTESLRMESWRQLYRRSRNSRTC